MAHGDIQLQDNAYKIHSIAKLNGLIVQLIYVWQHVQLQLHFLVILQLKIVLLYVLIPIFLISLPELVFKLVLATSKNKVILVITRLEYARKYVLSKIIPWLMLILKLIIDFACYYAHKLLIEPSEILPHQDVSLSVLLSLTSMAKLPTSLALLYVPKTPMLTQTLDNVSLHVLLLTSNI